MPKLGPIKRKNLIRCLKQLGWEGPFSGGKHQFMSKGNLILRVPNPYKKDIGKELLIRILRQAKIGKEEWEGVQCDGSQGPHRKGWPFWVKSMVPHRSAVGYFNLCRHGSFNVMAGVLTCHPRSAVGC